MNRPQTSIEQCSVAEALEVSESRIHALFEAYAARTPDAVALVHEQQRLTYAELNERANRLAHHLRSLGVQPDDRVALCMHRGLDVVVAVLGILKAGGAYVPLAPEYPAERLDFMLRDCGVRVLVTQDALRDVLPQGIERIVCLDADGPAIAEHPTQDVDCGVTADHLAYVMYTSGSTGMPKGVQIQHRSVRRLVKNAAFMRLDETTVMLHAAPLGFDLSTLEIWGPLLNGGRCVLYAEPVPTGPGLAQTIRSHGVNAMWLTSSLFNVVVDNDPAHLTGLTQLLIGGEALSVPHVARAAQALPDTTIINGYGPTECTTFATTHTIARPFDPAVRSVPIGRAINNTCCYVLDDQLQPVEVGAIGELYLGGEGLARGYLNRAELTAERFIADPFNAGERLYRTGDLVSYQPDGNLEFVGRRDFQVKLRGFRIELGEIEARLLEHPAAREAVVLVREDSPGDKRLVAYCVVARDGARGLVNAQELRSHLNARLPAYMVPNAFVLLPSLPLTANGKVDRKTLSSLPAVATRAAENFVAPSTHDEIALAAIWAEMLRVSSPGVEDDFYLYGGHSLLAAQMANRISVAVGVQLTVNDVLRARTIAGLAHRLIEARAAGTDPAPAPIETAPAVADDWTPASIGQMQIAYTNELERTSRAYVFKARIVFDGLLDAPALLEALQHIVDRHEIFRSRYEMRDGILMQTVEDNWAVRLDVVDVHGATTEEERRLLEEMTLEVLDPAVLPLATWRLLRIAPRRHVLLHVENHFVHDGWSFRLFLAELAGFYAQALDRTITRQPETPAVQFSTYCKWQRTWLGSNNANELAQRWRSALAGAPLHLRLSPLEARQPATPGARGIVHRSSIAAELMQGVCRAAERLGATPFQTMFGAFALLVSRTSGMDDFIIGSSVANRSRSEWEGVIGMIVNVVPVRLRAEPQSTIRRFLCAAQLSVMDAIAGGELPFAKIAQAARTSRERSAHPLVQILFSNHSALTKDVGFSGLDIEVDEALANDVAKFPLNVIAIPAPDAGPCDILFEYDPGIYDGQMIERFAAAYVDVLNAISVDVDQPVSAIDAWLPLPNGQPSKGITETPKASDACIHKLFATQAAKSPHAVALARERQHLTYAELDERANRLAHYLKGMGVRPDDRVAVCLHRGLEMVVGLLGVLKAGGAYVPLDPQYPAERLAFMLRDCAVRVVVTQHSLRDVLPLTTERIVCMDADWPAIAEQPAHDFECGATADHLAYVMYTSGSTGTPKGVQIRHRSIPRLVRNADFMRLDETTVMLHAAPLGFDASTLEIWGPLLNGGRCVLYPEPVPTGPGLAQAIRSHGVNTVWLTSALFNSVVDDDPAHLAGLSQLLTGGEALSVPHVARAAQALSDITIINGYGPTECTTFTTTYTIQRPFDASLRSVPIGRPITGTRCHVLDQQLQPVAVGVIGELYVGGDGLASGYLDSPELTAERFIADPFNAGERLYRTGDLVRYQSDGNLEYVGRRDLQVKLRGFRIELGEIEAALSACEGVTQSVAIVREDQKSDKRLVAYFTGNELRPAALRDALSKRLPGYMLPSVIVRLESMPLTRNGKLDRNALPAPEVEASRAPHVAPRSPAERTLAQIWCTVLGVQRVGVHDDFFDLGGHSLLVTRVMALVRREFGQELPLRVIFEAPTIAQLAQRLKPSPVLKEDAIAARPDANARQQLLDLRLRQRQQAARNPVARRSESVAVPLSFAQEGLWFLDQLTGPSGVYNVSHAVRLRGSLDVTALERSLHALMKHHQSLRTAFEQRDGGVVQVVQPVESALQAIGLEPLQVAGDSASEREQTLSRLLQAGMAEPFDLSRAPLMRAQLLRLESTEHVLLLVLHHIVADGWSMGVLTRELSALYSSAGDASALAPLPMQFGDYAVWQREHFAGGHLDKQLNYWRVQLAGMEALRLPTDRPRPARTSHRGVIEYFQLPASLLVQLKALAQRENATLFMVLLGAFQVLLMRYSRQQELAVGVPVAGRSRTEFEELVGYFVNTVVLRADLSGNPGFTQLLRRVRQTALDAYANQDVPFDRLVAELSPRRDLSRNPLYQVAFSLQSHPAAAIRMTGLEVERIWLHPGTAKFDLALSLTESEGALQGMLEYSTDLFEAATIKRMTAHFETLLAGIIAEPARPIAELPLLGIAERDLLCAVWNDTAAAYPDDQCLHQLFEAQVLRTPDATVHCAARQITYRDLDARANQLAHHLRSLGIGSGALVGLCVERSPDMLVAMLGTLKAGAAYVPLDPECPTERLADISEDAQLTLLITQSALQNALRFPRERVVHLDADAALIAGCPNDLPPRDAARDAGPDDPAYVIYTSGSTGKPKGVRVHHRAAVNFLHSMRREPGLTASDRFVAITTLSFDIALFELLLPLVVGARLHIATRDEGVDGKALRRLLGEARATAMFATPARWRMLIDAGWQGNSSFKATVGGEALPLDLAQQLLERCGELWNMYGPTETTVASTCWKVEDPAQGIYIGRPIANTTVWVLDEQGQICPIGVAGEIHIGGASVALGYLNRPELTAERFIADGFSQRSGARLYRTGDQGRWRNDGVLEHLGRLDSQVKIRGFRVELGEIEAHLATHPHVARNAVIVREDQPGDRRLVAYVVAKADMPATRELREHLRLRLPEYMLPQHYVALEAIPLLPNGKIDRKSLPAPRLDIESEHYVAPRSAAEQALAGIWSEVLGAVRIGVHDNFFDLGGHSLMAIAAMSRIREVFGGEPPLRLLFEAPTVAQMAERLPPLAPHVENDIAPVQAPAARGADGDARQRLLELRSRQRRPAMREAIPRRPGASSATPLSFAQEGLWFLDQLKGPSELYNISQALRLSGPLDAGALERSLHALIERHETLRTALEHRDEGALQVVRPAEEAVQEVRLEPLEVRGQTIDEREQALAAWLQAEMAAPFDLSRAPLLRVGLLRLAETEHVLLMVVHHIVSDGWSMGVMAQELGALYAAYRAGAPSPLAPLPIQFADYALWQRDRLQGERLEGHLSYWRKQLDGLKPLELPSDRPRQAQMSHRGNVERRIVPAELLDGLKGLARRKNMTLFMVLVAAFKLLLMRYCGQDDLTVGTPIAGRDRPELEGLIGYFVNTVVLRTDLSGNPSLEELLERVRHTALDAYAHQEVPFDRLVAELSPERNLNRNPLFDVLINQFDRRSTSTRFDGLVATPIGSQTVASKFAVTLYVDTREHDAALTLVFRHDLFTQAWGAHCVDQYVALLAQIADEPTRPIHGYSLLTDRTRSVLPDPTVEIAEPAQITVTSQVLEWARRTPDRIAVSSGGRHWSYAELAQRAAALAATLRAHGVGSGDVIAILGSKSVGVVGSMLAILMSAGAFLTIDPALPRERRRLMLREARAKLMCVVGDAQFDTKAADDGDDLIVVRVATDMGDVESPAAHEAVQWPSVAADDPAYVFFTSGSTGQPKAVLGCHKGLSQFLRWQQQTFDIGPDDRVSQLTALSFDPLLRDVFLPLTNGATLCIPQEEDTFDPLNWLRQERVTVVHTTPALLQSWLANARSEVALSDLRWLFLSGEALTDGLVAKWRQRFAGNGRIVNLYGPTETTMVRCFYVVPEELEQGIQPIGTPIAETQALVISANGRLCGVNEPGEIVLRTPFRSLGYLNRPDENRTRFRRNPFREDAGDLLYFTGDRGRYRPDGLLEIAGRLDDQVKIRGVRVEPGEVNAVLARHPAVQSCAVTARRNAHDEYELVAYVVKGPGQSLESRQLREHLKVQLPAAFVPGLYVFLDSMPLLPNGKVDRKALPEPDPEAHDESYIEPRSPIEEALVEMWSDLLGAQHVGAQSNFFDLGGHSLMATQVVSRIRAFFQIELPLRTLFEAPTVAQLAVEIAQHLHEGRGENEARTSAIEQVSRNHPLPVSFSQRRMWLLQQLEPEGTAYNMRLSIRLRGELNRPALIDALGALVARHEAFRTTFLMTADDDEPKQVIGEHGALPFEYIDLPDVPQAQREAEALRRLREHARVPFDLARGPLHRLYLVRISQVDHALLWLMHHAIGDAWSFKVLLSELSTTYNALCRQQDPALPAKRLDYADYASWQRRKYTDESLFDQLAFWQEQLKGMAPLALPADRSLPVRSSARGLVSSSPIEASTMQELRRVSARYAVTPSMTLLAAFQLLLARYCGQDDIALGMPIANRTMLDSEHLVGALVNTLVVRTDLSGNPSFAELLGRVRATALDAYSHQDVPFDYLIEKVRDAGDGSPPPEIRALFNVAREAWETPRLDGLDTKFFGVERGASQFDLSLHVAVEADATKATVECAADLFDSTAAERLLTTYLSLVDQVVADPEKPISDYALTSKRDRDALTRWNDTAAEFDRQALVHAVIGDQTDRSRNRVALRSAGHTLSYGELDARANRLAHALRARGAGRGRLIGLCVERGPQMVVAQLAVLKSGAAYVPLDPGYPAERLAYMARDADLALLITESSLVQALDWPRDRSLLLDIDTAQIDAQPDSALPVDEDCDARPEDACYVIYTSGSTGKPKGVIVPHRAVMNFLISMAREPGLGPSDCLLAVTTLSFDIAVLELLLPLTVGAGVVLASANQALDGRALRALLESSGATVMQATPASWRMLIEAGWTGAPALKALIGGEALPADLASRLLALTGELWNMYGPTETTVWSTCWRVQDLEQGISIGKPIANTTVWIVDPHGQLCPIGIPGEICIGGDGVTLGYLNRPDFSAERFVPDTQRELPGAKLYRTGDRGRWRHDGQLEHLGRMDSQVKVRGFRIELGEIEANLGSHAAVARCVVVALEDRPDDVRLAAYIVPGGEMPAAAELREHLRASLPEYMVPQYFVKLDSIPLLPNGKINRKGLPAPTETAFAADRAFVAPRNPSEFAVAEVWMRLLRVPQVSVTDNFFDLGGHSLLAMRAVAEIERELAVRINGRRMVFETLAQIASNLTPEASMTDPVSDSGGGWLKRLKGFLRS